MPTHAARCAAEGGLTFQFHDPLCKRQHQVRCLHGRDANPLLPTRRSGGAFRAYKPVSSVSAYRQLLRCPQRRAQSPPRKFVPAQISEPVRRCPKPDCERQTVSLITVRPVSHPTRLVRACEKAEVCARRHIFLAGLRYLASTVSPWRKP